jgi:hypothetical protein
VLNTHEGIKQAEVTMNNKIYVIMALLIFATCVFSVSNADIVLNKEINTYTGLSTDTKPTLAEKNAGSLFYETDKSMWYIWGGAAWTMKGGGYNTTSIDTLTAPSTASTVLAVNGFKEITYNVTADSINTNAIIAVLGKTTNGGWANLDANGDSTTFTSNKTLQLRYNGLASQDSVKLYFSSESGGTEANIIVDGKLGDQVGGK